MSKSFFKTGMSFFIVSLILFFPSLSFGLPSFLCNEKIMESGSFSGKLKNVSLEENRCFAYIQFQDNEEYVMNISCGDMDYLQSLSGKNIDVYYDFVRYWDEHDGYCAHEVIPKNIYQSVRTQDNTSDFIGFVEEYRAAGMSFIRLVDKGGKEIIPIGTYFEFDDSVSNCLGEALEGEYTIQITGSVKTYEDGTKGIDTEKPIMCKKLN